MNSIDLDGHSYGPEEFRALIADRDKWQAEALEQRAEVHRLAEADQLNGEAIRLLAEQHKAALTEWLGEMEFIDDQVRQAATFEGEPGTGQKITDAPKSTLYGVLNHIAPMLEMLRQTPVQLEILEIGEAEAIYPVPCGFVSPNGKRCVSAARLRLPEAGRR